MLFLKQHNFSFVSERNLFSQQSRIPRISRYVVCHAVSTIVMMIRIGSYRESWCERANCKEKRHPMRSYWRMKPVERLYQVLIDLGTTSMTTKKLKQKEKRKGKYLSSRNFRWFSGSPRDLSITHNNYKIVNRICLICCKCYSLYC